VRILHVVPTYLPAWRHGGPILAVHGLAKALVARGHEVTVFTTDIHGAGRLDVPLATPVGIDGVTVWYFPVATPRRLYRSPAMGVALGRRMLATDLVHLHSVFLWPTYAAARAAERAGVPYLLAPAACWWAISCAGGDGCANACGSSSPSGGPSRRRRGST